ncbi:hypothetical protein [Lewinella sp. IMCC34191]|uniref:hypothetical protein n=1 Tax=Lewinella sp. IMCC34191 TaxID=2259172 RepID=UPI000E257F7E|nr:hypothetical protein [Lewinella sp. IMCC34191]
MSTPENLSPDEERAIDNQIRAALFDAERGSHTYVSPDVEPELLDPFLRSIKENEERADEPPVLLKSLLPDLELPDLSPTAGQDAARAAVEDLLHKLSAANIHVDDYPFHLTDREYYDWLRGTLLHKDVYFPYGGGWNVHFSYAEIEPGSPTNMFSCLSMFLTELFRLDGTLDCWLLQGATYHNMETVAPPRQGHYLQCWRAGFRQLELIDLTPLPAFGTKENAAFLEFEIVYRGKLQNGDPVEYAGPGRVSLHYVDPRWEIVALRFPGFALAEESTLPPPKEAQ